MKFKVLRTSWWDNDEPPCDGAYKEQIEWTLDVRRVNDPAKLRYNADTWYTEGFDHRVNEDGHIERKFESILTIWCIDIEGLEGLVDFIEKNGEVVVTPVRENTSSIVKFEIEIYDGYRE